MNPVYRFLLRGNNKNLLNPYKVTRYSEGTYITDYIGVESGATYQFRDTNGLLQMTSCKTYAEDKTLIDETYGVSSVTIGADVAFIKVQYEINYNAFNLGFFKTPFTVFDSFYDLTHPLYKDDLALDYELETNEQYYRTKMSGELTFSSADYDIIHGCPFDQMFNLELLISYNRGETWEDYWKGVFWKTDCKFNDDDKTVKVTPSTDDMYELIKSGMDKEFDLIELAPAIERIKADKRSMIQIYVPGQKVVGCFLSNMWWEQECEAVTDEGTLVSTYHFKKNITKEIVAVTQTGGPQLPVSFIGAVPSRSGNYYTYFFDGGGYRFEFTIDEMADETRWEIYRLSDYELLWSYELRPASSEPNVPYSVTLLPVPDSGATGTVTLELYDLSVFARRISDVTENTYAIPANDIVANNRNYTRVVGTDISSQIYLSSALSDKPTEWGIYQPGQYYVMPYNPILGPARCYPIARSMWSKISFWYAVSDTDWMIEPQWRKEITLDNNYPIWSVISVLLNKVAPGIKHEGTTAYSQFLYGGNCPFTPTDMRVFITPKSNIARVSYDEPARKAPITLKQVLDMLCKCFRCYWFLEKDSNGDYKLRIEHIRYFMLGGTYTPGEDQIGNLTIARDLTKEIVTRNGKHWSYAQNAYEYDKPDMAAYYQFGWMDNQTQLFDGQPIEVLSQFVNKEKIENIDVANFSSDIDYMFLSPGDISLDGFALLCPVLTNGEYKLPYQTYTINHVDYVLQNAYAAFVNLQLYYLYDMPSRSIRRNGERNEYDVKGVKKLKIQEVSFPTLHDINPINLIKTELGDGVIQKISINLSSRNAKATLKYDTE